MEINKFKKGSDAEISHMKSVYVNFREKQLDFKEKVKNKILSYKVNVNVANGEDVHVGIRNGGSP